jgi:hypothetical protein
MSDMSLGETNKANNGTELVGGTFDENWGGNDYIFRVDGDVISPLPPGGVVGIRCSGFGGVGIEGIGGVKGVATEGGGTFGVQGVGNRYGVEGLLAGAEIPENRTEQAAVVGSAAGNFGIGVMGISNDLQGVLGSSQTHNGGRRPIHERRWCSRQFVPRCWRSGRGREHRRFGLFPKRYRRKCKRVAIRRFFLRLGNGVSRRLYSYRRRKERRSSSSRWLPSKAVFSGEPGKLVRGLRRRKSGEW